VDAGIEAGVEITSGGTPGPELAEEWEIDNNVYGSLPDAPPPRELAEAFVAAGWRARARSWAEYEVEREWARIELTAQPDRVLFAGVVDPARLGDLVAAFVSFGLRYSIELWDADRTTLLAELSG
jgi:hypothetical protein